MCGITGITGNNINAREIVFDGLGNIEYRGYDSWGVAGRLEHDSLVTITKEVGRASQATFSSEPSFEAIGHSRWATHGSPENIENAHPHQQGRVTLVHNGTVENYLGIKQQLLDGGYVFESETDSEIVAGYLDYCIGSGGSDAVRSAMQKVHLDVKGKNAFVFIVDGVRGLWGLSVGAPLIVGVDRDSSYIASDINGFSEHTLTVNYLDQNQGCHLDKTDRRYFDVTTGRDIQKRDVDVEIGELSSDKGDFDHHMMHEIDQQRHSIAYALDQDPEVMKSALELIQSGPLYITGCGTSHKVGMVARDWFRDLARVSAQVFPSSEMMQEMSIMSTKSTIIAISQSGETADVIEPVRAAIEQGVRVIALTNVTTSTLAQLATVVIPLRVGVEKAVASTKATTAQMAILYQLAVMSGPDDVGSIKDLINLSSGLTDQLNPQYLEHIKGIAGAISEADDMFIIGRGILHGIALETAIKIQEVSYIHAQGFPAGELKHGPIALIEDGVPCIVIGDDPVTLVNAEQLKSRGAVLVGVSTDNQEIFDYWLSIPDCGDAKAIACLIPLQILSYYLAIERDLDPDFPRNLAKSVTVV